MSDDSLNALAEHAGLSLRWTDYRGAERIVAPDVLRAALAAMQIPAATDADVRDSTAYLYAQAQTVLPSMLVTRCDQYTVLPPALAARLQHSDSVHIHLEEGELHKPEWHKGEWHKAELSRNGDNRLVLPPLSRTGYHHLMVDDLEIPLAVAPRRAFTPADVSTRTRLWGLSAQLYSLRRETDLARSGDGGFGDFSTLAELARAAALRGADALAISPVHALFSADFKHFSPYSPSSRLFLNALHIDVASIVNEDSLRDMIATLGLGDELARLQQLTLIDWPAAARVKLALLRKVWSQMGERWMQSDEALAQSFQTFREQGGRALENHARFEALHEQEYARDPALWNWRNWSASLRNVRSAAVKDFADSHADEVGFHIFLQWLASRGLAGAQRAAREEGMAIGLIADLAVGTDNGGSHVWSRQEDFLVGLQVGAPPDEINTHGQDWGLTTFSPMALQQHAFAPFLEMLRASLRHAGGLRIDHILGMRRLWVLPSGAKATDGVYLSYPQNDLLNLIALESQRHRAVIVGEDLGTVPPGFSATLADNGILGMQVMLFQRDHGLFVEPSRWSTQVLATTTTHDLPTIAGWWRGRDIDCMNAIGMLPEHSNAEQMHAERNSDRHAMWNAFNYAGVATGEIPPPDAPAAVVDAAIQFVAKTPAPLAMIPLEDLLGIDEQPNLPGTIDQHPNWRRRLPAPIDELFENASVKSRMDLLNAERG